ncbi:MAG: alpha/beta hydrolase [Desulfobacteraceae bacterium]|nr:alpha/beta hydrolase [Desulfobacteraceae bacterium]MBC2748951.1 alpha/beta hydrolase [Desulfobacteraceae bacterium]
MIQRSIIYLSLLTVLFHGNLFAHEQSIVELKTRGDVDQKYLLIEPENPTASVILFAGGHGGLELTSYAFGNPGMKWGKNNFLVRTSEMFADNSFVVAVIDSPSDYRKMNAIWRMSQEHADDISAVIKSLKQKYDLPVWVIGTSMGTFSVPNAAIRLNSEVDGMVLTSTVTRAKGDWKIKSSHPDGIINMELDKISAPSLIVSHKDDKCSVTPPEDSDKIKSALSNSKKVEVLYYSGGKPPKSEPCQALSAHGFYGIEEEVVNDICKFIKETSTK